MTFDHLLTKGESNACPGDFVSVQTIEHAENPLSVFRIDADAVVPHREQPPVECSRRREVYFERCLVTVLDRVIDKAPKNLSQHKIFGYHSRQRIGSHDRATLPKLVLELQKRLRQHEVAVDWR